MRSYWVGGLDSEQTYQFCVGYVRERTDGWVVPLDCRSVRTLRSRRRLGSRPYVPTLVSVFIIVLVVAPCVLCVLTAFVRRYRRRKQYKEPPTVSGVDVMCPSECGEVGQSATCRVEVTDNDGRRTELSRRHTALERASLRGRQDDVTVSPIPLNCLYDLPSTSISTTTSQTSLIGHA